MIRGEEGSHSHKVRQQKMPLLCIFTERGSSILYLFSISTPRYTVKAHTDFLAHTNFWQRWDMGYMSISKSLENRESILGFLVTLKSWILYLTVFCNKISSRIVVPWFTNFSDFHMRLQDGLSEYMSLCFVFFLVLLVSETWRKNHTKYGFES